MSLDEEIHELLDGSEYNADLQKCEEYIESAKRAILRISHQIEEHLVTSTANVTISGAGEVAATTAPIAPSATFRLPRTSLSHFLET